MVEERAKAELAGFLAEAPEASNGTTPSMDDIVKLAESASSFVHAPYWRRMSRMLNGTIVAEMEEMLAGDNHLALNRASVAIARKFLRMPYADIEQGKAALRAMDNFKSPFLAQSRQRSA